MRKKLYLVVVFFIDMMFDNLYVKPREIIRLCLHPGAIFGKNYYPELPQKSKIRIFGEQLWNIVSVGTIDEFYYLYAFNIKDFHKKQDYVHYKPFAARRNALNLSRFSNASCILRNKLYFGIFAKAIGIATSENVAYVKDGCVLLLADATHTTIDRFAETHNGTFFCKPLDGECGVGVFKLRLKNASIEINDKLANIGELEERLYGAEFIIQESITQHPKQKQLHASSINSIRLVTVRSLKDGQLVVLPSILRIGTGGNVVDNTSQGGIAVGFDIHTGRLNEFGLYKPQFGGRVAIHPDSGIRFRDYYIPYIQEVIEQAKYFHSFLDLHSIGWDIAIGEDGPIFIEGNDNWEINGPQSCNHGLAKEFKDLFYK